MQFLVTIPDEALQHFDDYVDAEDFISAILEDEFGSDIIVVTKCSPVGRVPAEQGGN